MEGRNAKILGIIVIVVLFCAGLYFLFATPDEVIIPPAETPTQEPSATIQEKIEVIGGSVEGRKIEAYTYGDGENHLLFVGGMHGGYEWNSVLLAYEMIDHIKANPSIIPPTLSVTIIPSLNPDGLFAVTQKEGRFAAVDVPADTGPRGTGRFNANDVDLNRNFDCKWQSESMWQGNTVSAGTAAFSEPEAKALRDFVLKNALDGVIFWHSAANAVYASECEAGILAETRTLMNSYATAAGYTPVDVFDAYPITGDAEGWLASINIPAITVELGTRTSIEWQKNIAGVLGLFELSK